MNTNTHSLLKALVFVAAMAITTACQRVEVEAKLPVPKFSSRFTSPSRFIDVYEIRDTRGSNDFILVFTHRGVALQPISRAQ